jgi:hypothetical protein
MSKLEELQKLCDKANSGPSTSSYDEYLEFIAAARTYMPLLIEIIKTLKSIQLCDDTYQDHEGLLEKALQKLES